MSQNPHLRGVGTLKCGINATPSVAHDGVFCLLSAPRSLLLPTPENFAYNSSTRSNGEEKLSTKHKVTAPTGAEGWVIYKCRCDECAFAYQALGATPRERRRNGPTPPRVHGTWNGYSNYGCRCEACLDACRETYDYAAGWRKANREYLNRQQRARRRKKSQDST